MKNLITVASLAAVVSAQIKGFNYGSDVDFQTAFKTAQNLVGTSGFASARLYTMIEPNTADTPTSAIQAAIDTGTTLLLGMWASSGQATISNEITALSSAISQYGSSFTNLIKGVSVGSEDLYRITPTGIANKAGIGAEPSDIVNYINQVRATLSKLGVSGIAVGHVDTWTAWVNSSNDAVISACDFLGVDAYPYFQNTMANDISNGYSLFDAALTQTQAASQGKPVWVTETGWPLTGATENQAVPSVQNAQTYWDQVGCGLLFGKVDTWWYQLAGDAFGISSSISDTTPLFNLTCSSSSGSSGSGSSSSSPSTPHSSTTVAAPSTPASAASGGGSGIVGTPTPGPSETGGSTLPSGKHTSSAAASHSTHGSVSGPGPASSGKGPSGSGSGNVTVSTSGSPSHTATGSAAASTVASAGAARNARILWF